MEYDPKKKMYIQEHEKLMERKLRRRLRSEEVVHNKNEIKSDNRLRNLEVTNAQQHAKNHGHRWAGKNNPSYNMSPRHRKNLIKAWEKRKVKFGSTGAKNPEQLRILGKKFGKLKKIK